MQPMKYVQDNLLQNEKMIYGVRPHWVIFSSGCWAMLGSIYIFLFAPMQFSYAIFQTWSIREIASTALFLLSAYWLTNAYIYYITSEYAVTNKRVVIKTGWIKRASLELMLDKVEGVLVDQTIIGRIFNYGAITIIGTGGTRDRFPFIPEPLEFRRVVQQAVDDFEHQMGRPS
ncbi:MAG: hypothetical protein COY58_02915 [Gammaproteobacteria bacterium CG_4_10_14_0_8_um_filter_38_16]|nr:MAG: hypothetical protein COY58_02915 [Gammaproteobacteria bacterium CG_4_10_14_0_8_um_filter_38_16]PJA03879.1 MAG: hypothetical protein COX72_03075 [Gammaproteobacteria bacterium CG_4_10_14_0_2_um_filter_38_22]PJB09507.1 MAG: hypothetical protein CO120_09730 [Gammaproteobacteria bacterium CG_4_9_14_3_um_filter_38_9]